ncbi:5-(carboxyamino)imidazole ribonucleotide synthase [Halomarina ordinaria]|uniref:N5-carboxyaminoimidazole ribonucleotide synthase n=1 Tax=Halomarina ordinaria TaxID=3033939 RepID=A0ABD5U744_9EURY|nr:5-(carboxyamino)imidazole ribonucleotide synthase [Halomarina sp. PSRA2]
MELSTPGPTVGVVGGGQLGRMLGEAAGPLGVELVVLDPTPACPASSLVRDQFVGDFDDEAGVRELAERADVLTYEIELADPDLLERVSEETGTPVHPSPATLRTIQDKLVQNEWLADAGVPLPEFVGVESAEDLRAAGDALGWPVMLKARRGGYDGRGNLPVEGPDDAERALAEVGAGDGGALAEALVPFERELSVVGAKGASGQAAFDVTETVHREEILRESVTPARTDEAVIERAREVAGQVLDATDGRGVFGIELFETEAGEILVNEVAPRPHNSGHWTIEGAHTSQFEQHLRAVLGWPLGDPGLRAPTVTANLLGDAEETTSPATLAGAEAVLSEPRAHLHWYGKRETRPLRKMGHVTYVGDEREREGEDDGVRESLETVEALLSRARERRAEVTVE